MRLHSRVRERIEKESLLSNGSLLWWSAALLDWLFPFVRHGLGGFFLWRNKMRGREMMEVYASGFLGVSARDNSKQLAMRRLSQLLVLALSPSSILLYQFLQPAIGGRGQSLKASCHSWGFDKAALIGIL
jgi:hypothetical protein